MRIFERAPPAGLAGFERDPPTHLPLVSEAPRLLAMALDFLPLPHSVVEFGCGKKASLLAQLWVRHGLPVHALKRGMILERDMSPEALETREAADRPHALMVGNPLFHRADLADEPLRRLLADASFVARPGEAVIEAGPFRLHHVERVQFAEARSHIYLVVTFWDPDRKAAVELVGDPTLCRERLFPVGEMRELLAAPEGWLFSAPLFGRFRLDPGHLTAAQREALADRLGGGDLASGLARLDPAKHARIVRAVTGAAEGSIGDPETWSYANNIRPAGDRRHDDAQAQDTGLGDPLREEVEALIRERTSDPERARRRCDALEQRTAGFGLPRRMMRDARWSGEKLDPLARLAAVVSAHLSLREVARRIEDGEDPVGDLSDAGQRRRLRGFGVRLRQRIESLALASTDEEGAIRAAALTPGFHRAAVETVRQMNRAGLTVWVDRVGNLHGLTLGEDQLPSGRGDERSIAAFARRALCLASHIDTAPGFDDRDERLGVMSGIEVASIPHDLHRYFGVRWDRSATGGTLMVTAFVDGEGAFSEREVATAGRQAVAGQVPVERVHRLTNAAGEVFAERLVETLRSLAAVDAGGEIEIANAFPVGVADPGEWFEACPAPTCFFSPHLYERHLDPGGGCQSGEPRLAERLLRGTLLQIAVARAFLAEPDPCAVDLPRLVQATLPPDWEGPFDHSIPIAPDRGRPAD